MITVQDIQFQTTQVIEAHTINTFKNRLNKHEINQYAFFILTRI